MNPVKDVLPVACLVMLSAAPAIFAQPETSKGLLAKAEQIIAIQETVIESQDKDISNLQAEIRLRDELIEEVKARTAEQNNLIELYKGVAGLKDEVINSQKEQIAVYLESVKDRDAVIKQLAQPRKTSTWQKIAESITPVASIIAIAIASNGN